MPDFKGSQVHLDLHLELALEPFWHSPRVPADATSAILELVCHQHSSFLIHDLERTFGRMPAVAAEVKPVFFARTANESGADDQGALLPLLHMCSQDKGRSCTKLRD